MPAAVVLAAGLGSALVAGFYVAFSATVMQVLVGRAAVGSLALGAAASVVGWALTMSINVPLNNRLAAGTVAWLEYERPWTRANHVRAGLSASGAIKLLASDEEEFRLERPCVATS